MERVHRRRQYDTKIVDHVAGLVQSGTLSVRKAASMYNIPRSTLHDRVVGRFNGRTKPGARSVLSETEENRLATWAVKMAKIGYGRTRKELVITVKKILDEDGRKNPFKNNTPGKDWLNAFFKRHPDLSIRSTLQLGKERAVISPEKVNKWFTDLKNFLVSEIKDTSVLYDPARIYNADESGFSLCPKGCQVIGYKGAPVVYNFTNSDKTQLTVMASMSASGHFIPPMIVYPGKRFGYNPLEGFEDAVLGRTDNGWMDSQLFCDWLTTVFIPAVDERQVKRPLLLFVDGHSTHITLQASDICLQNGIVLYCLLEHASHVMQPLDLRLFSALKESWRQSVRDWQVSNIGQMVTKRNFAPIFKQAWIKSTTTDIAVKGFRDAGLYPLDPEVVTKSIKLEPSKLFNQTISPHQETKDRESQSEPILSEANGYDIKQAKSLSLTSEKMPPCQGQESNAHLEASGSPTQESLAIVSQIGSCQSHTQSAICPSTPTSPFSKHLQMPSAPQTSTKIKRKITLPKAITGNAYREFLIEKQKQKEKEENEKQARKMERERKKREREEEMIKRKRERLSKRMKQEAMQREKKILQELKSNNEDISDDSDDAIEFQPGKCYECMTPYDNDFIQCDKCFRKFHIECTNDELDDMLPFECKYC